MSHPFHFHVLTQLEPFSSRVIAVAAQPQGTILAVAIEQGFLILWDVQTSRVHHTFTLPADVLTVAWSEDGSFLAASLQNHDVWLWTHDGIFVDRIHTTGNAAVAFQPGTDVLCLLTIDGVLQFFDILPLKMLSTFSLQRNDPLRDFYPDDYRYQLVFSPTGTQLATNCTPEEGTIQIWEITSERSQILLSSHALLHIPLQDVPVWVLSYHPSTAQLFALADRTIYSWDTKTAQRRAKIAIPHAHPFTFCVSLADLVIIGDATGIVYLWHILTKKALAQFHPHPGSWEPDANIMPLTALTWIPHEDILVTAGWIEEQRSVLPSSTVRLWKLARS